MLGINLNLLPEDVEMLSAALTTYQRTCPAGKKPIVNLVMKRLKEDNPRFDGMYLRAMEEALDQFSATDSSNNNGYQKFKQHLVREREKFQYNAMRRLFETA